jgi:surface carbohydrate biosynthesis protein (TIGR04326 family)
MPSQGYRKGARASLLIWDAEGPPAPGDRTTVLWRSYDTGGRDDVISMPQRVEENAVSLKARYLAWIYELGVTKIKGKRIVDQLELRPGLSYWWMTLFAEKCNFSKSPRIDDAIRLMAFEEWALNRPIGGVVVATANQQLAECIRLWCAGLGAPFEWQRVVTPPVSSSWVRRVYQALPHNLQGLIWSLRYLLDRQPLRGVGLKEWQQADGRTTFFSYSDNWVPDAAKQGHYESLYWAHLPDVLQQAACKTNWLHLYVKDALSPTSKQAADTLRAFNTTGRGLQHHVTLDTFLNYRVVCRTVRDWCRLLRVGIGLKNQLIARQGNSIDLWPLFEDDWRQSMSGTVAMGNLLTFNLFESALACLPQQQLGVYLQENQGWESGLIQAWQAAGHGRLIGTPHSTVRFWDLRYFFDPRSYRRGGTHDLPMPTQVTVNGPAMRKAFSDGGYPVDDMVEVEALRYHHLGEAKVEKGLAQPPRKGALRVLVLGDYLRRNTQRQMNLLMKAAPSLPTATVIVVKPHPNCPIQPTEYPSLSMTVTTEPIAKLLANCDVAYSSAVTSAAVDAYCAGVPLVSDLDPHTLNLSPLRGCAGAMFASTPEELATALMSAVAIPRKQSDRDDFFTIDAHLPRWRKLFAELSQQ